MRWRRVDGRRRCCVQCVVGFVRDFLVKFVMFCSDGSGGSPAYPDSPSNNSDKVSSSAQVVRCIFQAILCERCHRFED